MKLLDKIISGGQTGADQGGLMAALALKISTGGYAPPNYITDTGPNPSLLKNLYGLEEVKDPKIYPRRTRLNVMHSDGTVWVGDAGSPGGVLTIRTCKELGRTYITNPNSVQLRQWIIEHSIKVLNVAGNRERINPGIGERTRLLIYEAVV